MFKKQLYIITLIIVIISFVSAQVSTQNEFAKLIVTNDNEVFFFEGEFLMSKKENAKNIFYANLVLPNIWDNFVHPANYIIYDNKLIFIRARKDDLVVNSKHEYNLLPWILGFECADLDKVHYHPERGIVFSHSLIRLHFEEEFLEIYDSKPIYTDFLEYNNKALLFIKTGDCKSVFSNNKNTPLDNSMLVFRNTASICDNKWELVNQFELKEDRGVFVTSKNSKGDVLIHFQNGTTYRLNENIDHLEQYDGYKRKGSILLYYNGSHYWITNSEANALKESSDAISFLNLEIIGNRTKQD